MSQLGIDPKATLTSGRVTTLTLDLPEQTVSAPAYDKVRKGREVATPSTINANETQYAQNVMFWKGIDVWTLKPVQSAISDFSEYNVLTGILTLNTSWTMPAYVPGGTVAGMDEENKFRAPSDLLNASSLFQVPTSDPFMVKKVPAGQDWTAALSTSHKLVTPEYTQVSIDRILESKATFRENQGFFLRWSVPGTIQNNPHTIWSFYFGQMVLHFDGDGYARLYEFPVGTDGSGQWPLRHKFRYSKPGDIAETPHTLAIWPYYSDGGKRHIAFANSDIDVVGAATGLDSSNTGATAVSVYNADSGIRGSDADQSPGYVTSKNILRVDCRRDLRAEFQFSTLQWATSGSLTDVPDSMPPTGDAAFPLSLEVYKREPNRTNPNTGAVVASYSVTGQIYDTDTRLAWVDGPDGAGHIGYKPYVVFTFTGDGTDTPTLYGYKLSRPTMIYGQTPGAFSITNAGGIDATGITDVQLSGAAGDPTAEQGHVTINDVRGAYPRLVNRGRLSSKLVTTFQPPASSGDPLQTVVLQRGEVYRPASTKKGKAGRLYPSPNWFETSAPLLGRWKILDERVETSVMRIYGQDPSGATDISGGNRIPLPWKVTDVIRDLLTRAGEPVGRVNIPDLPFRLWKGTTLKEDEFHLAPTKAYSEMIQRLARNYLGAWLYFEPNAGTDGQWTLLFPAPLGATPLVNFSTLPSVANVHKAGGALTAQKIPHLLSAYPANTLPVFGELHTNVVPPDFNFVYVCTGVPVATAKPDMQICNFLWNPKSLYMPGYPDATDPDHPDYIGHCKPLVIVDPSLQGPGFGGKSVAEVTQNAVDLTVIRLYDFLCHAQRLVHLTSLLWFIKDAAIGNKYRSLRFQDTVALDGVSYIIKNPEVDYKHDHQQLCEYELIDPLPGKL